MKDEIEIFTTKDVADILRITETCARNIINRGELKAFKLGRKGGFRVSRDNLFKYIDEKEQGLHSALDNI